MNKDSNINFGLGEVYANYGEDNEAFLGYANVPDIKYKRHKRIKYMLYKFKSANARFKRLGDRKDKP